MISRQLWEPVIYFKMPILSTLNKRYNMQIAAYFLAVFLLFVQCGTVYALPIVLPGASHYVNHETNFQSLWYQTALIIPLDGRSDENLLRPTGMCFASDDLLIVVDSGESKFYQFDVVTGKSLGSFGKEGEYAGHFRKPETLIRTANGKFVISDRGNHRIQFLDQNFKSIDYFGTMGEKTDKLGFAEPMGIAANEKRLYVVDRYNSVVKVYSLKHKIFRHMMGYNRFEPQKSLRYPKDIALFNDVTVVSDFGNDRLMFFSIDKTTPGKFLRTLGARPENPLKLHAPYGVEFDQLGNLYVADLGNNRVLKFDCPAWENGTISVVITSTDDGRPLESPQCVKVNSRGEVAVLDVDRREVIIFQADWYHKGRMLYEAGEFEKAIPCFEKANTNALRAKRVNVYSLFYYAVSLEHLDRLEEAWQVYDQLVKKFTYGPIFKRARYRMKHLEPLLLR